MSPTLSRLHQHLLSDQTRKKGERLITTIAILSFFTHLIIILVIDLNVIVPRRDFELLINPIAAIYTPFSFILVYEVYLLVYYLPKSTSYYIIKQYEIISLIVIRRIFKDLSKLDLEGDWWANEYNLQFVADLITTVLLFVLILYFYRLSRRRLQDPVETRFTAGLETFIVRKRIIAVVLVPIFFLLGVFSLGNWAYHTFIAHDQAFSSIGDLNLIFFNEFFTILILTDVLLLLFSLFHQNEFHKVIRNSGFIVSTILIRLSFASEGLLNNLLILIGVLFGVIILVIHNRFDAYQSDNKAKTSS